MIVFRFAAIGDGRASGGIGNHPSACFGVFLTIPVHMEQRKIGFLTVQSCVSVFTGGKDDTCVLCSSFRYSF